MKHLNHRQLHRQTKNQVELQCDNKHLLSIRVLDHGLIRVWLRRNGEAALSRTWMVENGQAAGTFDGKSRDNDDGFPCPPFALVDNGETVTVSTDCLRLTIGTPLALSWARKNTEGEWQTIAADCPTTAYLLGHSRRDVAHFMQRRDDDIVIGLGEKSGTVNRSGKRYQMRNLDALGYNAEHGDPLYKHWPFYQVQTANGDNYGIFYDNLSTCWFDVGNERDNYHGSYRSYRAEDGDIDYYFILGDSIKDVTQQFVRLTGKHTFLPKWSLGYSGSTMHYTDAPDAQAQLLQFIRLCKQHHIPCDSFQLSSGYTSIGDKRYVFHWNRDKIPEPTVLSQSFHDAGLKLAANIKPCLLIDHPRYAEAAEADLFIKDSQSPHPERSMFWDAEGSHLDFTHPDTIAWWQKNVIEQLLENGIDSTWNDNNEYEIWDDNARCHGFGETIPIRLIRPLMPLLMMRASYEAQQRYAPELRPYLISRSGCPGMQRYAQTWSGDNLTCWHTLKWNIRMGIGMSLSGMYHIGHDVGGFAGGKPDAELFVRWVQSALLLPRFTIHSWNDDGSVNEPWMHEEVTAVIADNLALRYRLLPYLYTLLWQVSAADEAFVRPTFWNYPNDSRCYEDCDDYLIGQSLLVTPIVEPKQRQRQVYLPDNRVGWYYYADGCYYQGGQTVTADVPLDCLPLWVAADCLLAESELRHADSPEDDTIRYLRVFPPSAAVCSACESGTYRAEGIIFDDDGISRAYRQGQDYRLHYTITSAADSVNIVIERRGHYRPAYADNVRFLLPDADSRRFSINGADLIPNQAYAF